MQDWVVGFVVCGFVVEVGGFVVMVMVVLSSGL